MQDRQKGLLLTALGVLLISPDALVLRWVSADAMQILVWRGGLIALGLTVLLVARYRRALPRKLRGVGWTGLGCALCYATSNISFVQAMNLAGAANTLLIFSVSPLFAGFLGWIWLGERLPLRTVLAILTSLVGIALIVSDETPGSSLAGNLLALVAAIALASNFTLARSKPLIDMSPGLLLGAVLVSMIGYLVGGTPQIAGEKLFALVLLCALLLPMGFMLIQLGPRTISATEVGLMLLLEVIIGPLWVWLLLDEEPTETVLLGGAIVLFALLGHALLGWRQTQPSPG